MDPKPDDKEPIGLDLSGVSGDPKNFDALTKPLVIGEENEYFGVDQIESFIPADVSGVPREKLRLALEQFLSDGPKTRDQIEEFIKDDSAKLKFDDNWYNEREIVGAQTRKISEEDVLDATHITQRTFPAYGSGSQIDPSPEQVIPDYSKGNYNDPQPAVSLEENKTEFVFSVDIAPSFGHPDHSEDRYFVLKEAGSFGVFDGVGGHAGGEDSAKFVSEYIRGELSLLPKNITQDDWKEEVKEMFGRLRMLIKSKKVGATTAVVAKVWDLGSGVKKQIVANAGDSRCYVYRREIDGLEQITTDDSLFIDLVSGALDQGMKSFYLNKFVGSTQLTQEEADEILKTTLSPDQIKELQRKFNNTTDQSSFSLLESALFKVRNVITNLLSEDGKCEARFFETELGAGDISLLTSDGVHDNLTDVEILEEFTQGKFGGKDSIGTRLVKKALGRSQDGSFRSKYDDATALAFANDIDPDMDLSKGIVSSNSNIDPGVTNLFSTTIRIPVPNIPNPKADSGLRFSSPVAELQSTPTEVVVEKEEEKQSTEAEIIAQSRERKLLEKLDTLDWEIPQAETVRQGEWKDFKLLQEHHADIEARKSMSLRGSTSEEEHMELFRSFEDVNQRYSEGMSRTRLVIEETIREEYEGMTLSPEQEALLRAKIRKVLFHEFAEKSQSMYLKRLRELKSETLLGKVMNSGAEALRTIAKTKAFAWYTKQNKWVRLGVTTALATGVGFALGGLTAGGAITYGGYRMARGAASFAGSTIGTLAGENIKSWSIEELEKKEAEELEALKNANLSLEDQSSKLREIRERYEKERRNARLKKAALTIGAGAGAGMLSGLAENILNGNTSALNINKPKVNDTVNPIPNPVQEIPTPNPVTQVAQETQSGFFANQEVLIHQVKSGDSLWKILNNTLENDSRFKGMSEARKTFVLSNLTNKVLENPEQYGVHDGGAIVIGEKTDFTSLFKDKDSVEDIFKKAESIGASQESVIIENNKKIEAWIKANPGKQVDVNEVLSSDVSNTEKESEVLNLDNLNEMQKTLALTFAEGYSDLIKELKSLPNKNLEINSLINEVESSKSNLKNVDWNSSEMLGEMQDRMKEIRDRVQKIRNDIENLKPDKPDDMALDFGKGAAGISALGALSTTPSIYKNTIGAVRSMRGDVETERRVPADVSDIIIENSFKSGIDEIYGNKGIFNIGNKSGIDSKEWKEISGLNAKQYLVYATKDASESGLSRDVISKLENSKKHTQFKDQLLGLLDQVKDVDFKPYDSETVAGLTKRVAGFVYKRYLQSQPKN